MKIIFIFIFIFITNISFAAVPEKNATYIINQRFDRSDIPSYITLKKLIWDGSYPSPISMTTSGHTYLACFSKNNPQYGSCPAIGWDNSWHISSTSTGKPVLLTFTEKNTKFTTNIMVNGSMINGSCSIRTDTGFTGAFTLCNYGQTNVTMGIPYSELNKIPFGGIWQAQMKLKIFAGDTRQWGTMTVNITFDITDNKNISIFFPAENSVDNVNVNIPLVKSNSNEYNGSKNIPICLYDGYSNESHNMILSATSYPLVNQVDKKNHIRVDMTVDGKYTSNKENGKQVLNLNIANNPKNNAIRYIMPSTGIGLPQPCSLHTLNLSVNHAKNLSAGSYRGKVDLLFTPSLH